MGNFTQDDFDALVKDGDVPEGPPGDVLDGPPDDDAVVAAAAAAAPKEPEPTPGPFDGDDVPEELRGKSAEEVLQVYGTLKDVSQTMASQIQQAPAPTPTPAPVPLTTPEFSADDLVDDGGKSFNDKMEDFYRAKISPLEQTIHTNAAHSARIAALQQSEILREYEPTLNKIIAQNNLNAASLGNPQTWAILESMVGREHFQEIVAKQAKKLSKPDPEPTAGVQAAPEGGSPASSLNADELATAKAFGIDPNVYAKMKPHTNQG